MTRVGCGEGRGETARIPLGVRLELPGQRRLWALGCRDLRGRFTCDGFLLYGSPDGQGVLAKDSQDKPLNGFSVHDDEECDWPNHVTPGTPTRYM